VTGHADPARQEFRAATVSRNWNAHGFRLLTRNREPQATRLPGSALRSFATGARRGLSAATATGLVIARARLPILAAAAIATAVDQSTSGSSSRGLRMWRMSIATQAKPMAAGVIARDR